MNAEERRQADAGEQGACPKRLWVMLTLSDDEAVEQDGSLPQGLKFHLSRCPSCRAVADRLNAVTESLGEIAEQEPTPDLQQRADARATTALAEGATPTGRVTIADEPERLRALAGTGRRFLWVRYAAYVAAAAAVFGIGLYYLSTFAGRDGRRLAEHPKTQSEPETVVRKPREVVKPGLSSDQGGERPGGPTEVAPDYGDARLADTGRGLGATKDAIVRRPPRKRAACRHHSHVDAANCDDPSCIHRATVLPDARGRNLGWLGPLIDTPRHTLSTERGGRRE
ncbi:MAG: hypothetical protein PVI86_17050 [Phycisphaerae bacterium]|jgi:hypothetical protein